MQSFSGDHSGKTKCPEVQHHQWVHPQSLKLPPLLLVSQSLPQSMHERCKEIMRRERKQRNVVSFKWAAFRDGVFICPGAQLKVFWKGCFCISSFMALSSLIGAEMRALGRIATRWTRMTSERNTLDVPDVDPSTWAVR